MPSPGFREPIRVSHLSEHTPPLRFVIAFGHIELKARLQPVGIPTEAGALLRRREWISDSPRAPHGLASRLFFNDPTGG